ncbi:MAG TPA: response regulator [Steroidobacter sp.]
MKGEVLVLDDDETVLQILSATLKSAGYRCHETSRPEEAIATVLRHEAISVVVSDIYMPGMTGFQFVDRLSAQPLNRPCPRVLLLTAQPSLQSAVDALRLGVCDFLTKPVRSADLIEAVKKAMERAAQDRRDYASPVARIERLIRQSEDLTEHLRSLAMRGEGLAPAVPVFRDDEGAKGAPAAKESSVLDTIEMLRQLRSRYSQYKLDDLSWDLLLELARAERQRQRLSVSGLMISTANVSPTTLLRRINDLTRRGYISRIPDPNDARRDFVSLTPKARELVTDFIEQAYLYMNEKVAGRQALS